MGGIIKIRYPNELWWDTVSYEKALEWDYMDVSWMDNKSVFVFVNGICLEMGRFDYDKIMSNKAFQLKFDLKPFSFDKKNKKWN